MTQTKLVEMKTSNTVFGVHLQAKICPWKRGELEEDDEVAVPAKHVPGG